MGTRLSPDQIAGLAQKFAAIVFIQDGDCEEETVTVTPAERDTIVAALKIAAGITEIAGARWSAPT